MLQLLNHLSTLLLLLSQVALNYVHDHVRYLLLLMLLLLMIMLLLIMHTLVVLLQLGAALRCVHGISHLLLLLLLLLLLVVPNDLVLQLVLVLQLLTQRSELLLHLLLLRQRLQVALRYVHGTARLLQSVSRPAFPTASQQLDPRKTIT